MPRRACCRTDAHTAAASGPGDPPAARITVDRFTGPLSLAWRRNAKPAADWIDAAAPPGRLRRKAVPGSPNLWDVGNILSRKLPAECFTVTARVRLAAQSAGGRGGLALSGATCGWIGLERGADGVRIVQRTRTDADTGGAETLAAGPSAAGPV